MTPLAKFEKILRSSGPSSDALTREAYQRKLVYGEHNVRREIRRMARRRRFIYNAAVDPPDEATWAEARARRIEELGDDLLAAARQIDNLPVQAESILSKAEAQELKERLLFQEGAAFFSRFHPVQVPTGHLLGDEAGVHGCTDRRVVSV